MFRFSKTCDAFERLGLMILVNLIGIYKFKILNVCLAISIFLKNRVYLKALLARHWKLQTLIAERFFNKNSEFINAKYKAQYIGQILQDSPFKKGICKLHM